MIGADARILWQLARGQPRKGSHAERLQSFYAPQARRCDDFREHLLHGRRDLIEWLAPPASARVVEADAVTYRPVHPVDCVHFSYSLTMIPDWRRAIDNALAMPKPGGKLGVVDFYVSDAKPEAGLMPHGAFTRNFWPRWFAHDGVRLNPEHLRRLRTLLPDYDLLERRVPAPYLPGLRMPY